MEETINLLPITVIAREIGQVITYLANAREIHTYLESKYHFSDWMQYQIDSLKLQEEVDYIKEAVKGISTSKQLMYGNLAPPPRVEYYLTINISTHIAMASRTDKGFEVRTWFMAKVAELTKERQERQKGIFPVATDMSERDWIVKCLEFYDAKKAAEQKAGELQGVIDNSTIFPDYDPAPEETPTLTRIALTDIRRKYLEFMDPAKIKTILTFYQHQTVLYQIHENVRKPVEMFVEEGLEETIAKFIADCTDGYFSVENRYIVRHKALVKAELRIKPEYALKYFGVRRSRTDPSKAEPVKMANAVKAKQTPTPAPKKRKERVRPETVAEKQARLIRNFSKPKKVEDDLE